MPLSSMNTYEVTLSKVTTCKATVRVEASSAEVAAQVANGFELDWYVVDEESKVEDVSPAA